MADWLGYGHRFLWGLRGATHNVPVSMPASDLRIPAIKYLFLQVCGLDN